MTMTTGRDTMTSPRLEAAGWLVCLSRLPRRVGSVAILCARGRNSDGITRPRDAMAMPVERARPEQEAKITHEPCSPEAYERMLYHSRYHVSGPLVMGANHPFPAGDATHETGSSRCAQSGGRAAGLRRRACCGERRSPPGPALVASSALLGARPRHHAQRQTGSGAAPRQCRRRGMTCMRVGGTDRGAERKKKRKGD